MIPHHRDSSMLTTELPCCRELEEKRKKEQKKAEAAARRQAEEAKKLAKGKTPPNELWSASEEYSQYDERGVPTHDAGKWRHDQLGLAAIMTVVAAGEPLAKSSKKKLEKAYSQQVKLHEKVCRSCFGFQVFLIVGCSVAGIQSRQSRCMRLFLDRS